MSSKFIFVISSVYFVRNKCLLKISNIPEICLKCHSEGKNTEKKTELKKNFVK